MIQLSMKQLGALLLVILGFILAFSPVKTNQDQQISPKKLIQNIHQRSDHITAEQLGHLIIDKDPGYQLIDLRSAKEYQKFHIESAINIPLESLFDEEYLQYVHPEKMVVLYTNGGTHAAQAWVLLQQLGYKNTTVLLGGLNYWVDVYSNPDKPKGVYADSEIFDYQFKVSAGQHFMGELESGDGRSKAPEVPVIQMPVRPKKKKRADEGC